MPAALLPLSFHDVVPFSQHNTLSGKDRQECDEVQKGKGKAKKIAWHALSTALVIVTLAGPFPAASAIATTSQAIRERRQGKPLDTSGSGGDTE